MKNSNGPRNAGRLSVVAVLAVGCIAGNAVAQQQMRRIPEAAPAPPPPNAVVRVAPATPPPAPAATAKAISTAAPVAPAPVPIPPPGSGSRGQMASQPPTMNKGGLAPNRAYVPFPQNMTHTVDPKTCTQHGGFAAGLGCTAGLPHGMLALVWDCANCKVDGYRLYRVDGTRHDPVSIPANGASFTAALLDAPQGGFGGHCYAATAYRGTYESELSDPFCADGGSVVSTVTLQPDHVRTSEAFASSAALGIVYQSKDDLEVGGMHSASKALGGDAWANWIARGGLHFDLGKLAQKHVFSAKLHVTVDTTHLDAGGVDHGTSCTSLIALGQDQWWIHTDWVLASGQRSEVNGFDTPARLKPGSMDGPNSAYDVTPIVSDWVQGAQQNFGFVLMTDDAGINGFSQNACYTTYTTSYSLEVKFSG
jgi:hypothetical protein